MRDRRLKRLNTHLPHPPAPFPNSYNDTKKAITPVTKRAAAVDNFSAAPLPATGPAGLPDDEEDKLGVVVTPPAVEEEVEGATEAEEEEDEPPALLQTTAPNRLYIPVYGPEMISSIPAVQLLLGAPEETKQQGKRVSVRCSRGGMEQCAQWSSVE